MKWTLISCCALYSIENQISPSYFNLYTNLNRDPLWSSWLLIWSSIFVIISKNYVLFIWGYRIIFLKEYVKVAYNFRSGSRVILFICLKLYPYKSEKYSVSNFLIRSSLVSAKNIFRKVPLISTLKIF